MSALSAIETTVDVRREAATSKDAAISARAVSCADGQRSHEQELMCPSAEVVREARQVVTVQFASDGIAERGSERARRPAGAGIAVSGRRTSRSGCLAGRAVVARAVGSAAEAQRTGAARQAGPALPVRQVPAGPVRLTRRGWAVAVVAVAAAIALVILLVLARGAQATSNGQPGAGYQGMHEIVVRPGQTLWSIALAAEPTANTAAVVQQIMTANAMTSTTVAAGQLLWVPR